MALMSTSRIVPILLLGLLALAALVHGLRGRKNQTLDGVVVQDVLTYEFYPSAKDCNYRGTPYVVLPNESFYDIFTRRADIGHIDRALHSTWRATLNGNLSAVGWHKYRKTYWRELSVNYVVDAAEMSCGGSQLTPAEHP